MRLAAVVSGGLFLLFFAGCAQRPKPLYNYGSYSQDYYAYKKNMSDETALTFQKNMEEALAHPELGRSGRVPPGMYADLGYLYLRQGNNVMARRSFETEKRVYPESTRFMERLIARIDAMEQKEDDVQAP